MAKKNNEVVAPLSNESALERLEAMITMMEELKVFIAATPAEEEPEEKKAAPKNATKGGKGKAAAKAKEVEEPEEEDEDEDEDSAPDLEAIIDEYELGDMEVEDLEAELALCKKKVKLPKKKTVEALATLLAEQIASGNYEPEDDEEDEDEEDGEDVDLDSMELPELLELAEEMEVKIPTKIKKNKKAIIALLEEQLGDDEDEEDNEDVPEEDDESEDDADDAADNDEIEVSAERAEAEAKIEKDIRAKIKKGSLTVKKIKAELKNYYNGNEDCKGCKSCSEEEIVDCYIQLQKSFVDDEGDVHDTSEAYERNGVGFCCGTEMVESPSKKDTYCCEICSEEYSLD
jgi:hypothetical protein